MTLRHPAYQHDEWMWPIATLAPLGMGGAALALWLVDGAAAWAPIALLAGVAATLVLLFGRFRIELDGQTLRWSFGLLGWPRWQVALSDIAAAEPGKATWQEGIGVRRTGDGTLYRALASTTVRLRLHDRRHIRLGTPEPQRLIAFLEPRLGAAPRR